MDIQGPAAVDEQMFWGCHDGWHVQGTITDLTCLCCVWGVCICVPVL